eukprot:1148892-Pelagomonas_calceolata.AAC.9
MFQINQSGHTYVRSMQKAPDFWPQIAPSEIYPLLGLESCLVLRYSLIWMPPPPAMPPRI